MNGDEKAEVMTQMRIAIGKMEVSIDKDINNLSKLTELRFSEMDKAIRLQAVADKEHMQALNNETDRVNALVPIKEFEDYKTNEAERMDSLRNTLLSKLESIEKRVVNIEKEYMSQGVFSNYVKEKSAARQAFIIVGISSVVSIIAIFISNLLM